MRRRKKFGNKSLEREIKLVIAIFILFGFTILAIIAGLTGVNFSFDNRDKAAGKTYFVNDGKELEDTLAIAADSDAIFLKVGSYTTTNVNGFTIKDKDIRILGAGEAFVEVTGNNNSYVFNVQNANVSFESFRIRGANKDGVLVTNTGSKEVSFKDIEFTSNSGSAINTDTKSTVLNSLINQNGTGITTSNGELIVKNTVIQNSASNGIEVKTTSTSSITVENSIITKNKGDGISLAGGKNHIIKNVTLSENNNGIKETIDSFAKVSNTIVQNSTADGISFAGTNSTASYTNSYNNPGGNFKPSTLQSNTGNLSVVPQTVSNIDFHLATTSELKDKGNPDEKDADGSRVDIGAYGGFASIDNANSAPQITSTPPNFVKAGQAYTYEIKATDPDGDALDYIVLNSNIPAWLKQSGNKFSGTPSESDVGFVGLSVVVTDHKGHNVVQPISINVVSATRVITTPTPSTPTTAPTVAPTSTPIPSNPVPSIKIISPIASTKFDTNTAEIKWDITNRTNVEKIVLLYSSDKEKFQTITTLSPDRNSFPWDITNITNGSYMIKVEVYEKGSTTPIAQQSEQFEINKTSTSPTAQNVVITKISPEDNDVVDNRRQTILVEFTPKVDLDKTKSFLKINGENVEFQTTQGTLYYTPTTDFTGSRIQVEAKVVSNEGSEDSKKWTFKLPTNANPVDTTPDVTKKDTINILGLKLPKPIGLILLAAIIFGLLILILYFVVKLIRTIRDERQGNLEAEFTEYYDVDQTADNSVLYQGGTVPYETSTTTQTYTVDNNPNNIEQTYLVTPDQTHDDLTYTTTTTETKNTPNAESVSSETYVTEPEQTVTTTTYSTDSTQVPTQTDDVTQTITTTQTTSDPQVLVDDNTASSQTTSTTTTTTSGDDEDPYVAELKKKYGISDTDIAEYHKNEEAPIVTTTTTTSTISEDPMTDQKLDDNDSQPDPSQASKPPKKK